MLRVSGGRVKAGLNVRRIPAWASSAIPRAESDASSEVVRVRVEWLLKLLNPGPPRLQFLYDKVS